MDIHLVPGIKANDVAEAHRKDILLEKEHHCKCMTYWIDEERENVFCLIEAPEKEAVIEMHRRSHGLVPNKIIEVNSNIVESFLGRIYDPADARTTDTGLKVFHDPSFRILLVTKITDPVLLKHKWGTEKTNELLASQNELIRNKLIQYDGSEVEHEGDGFIISFNSATKAVKCALDIQKALDPADAEISGFKIGISSGEPIGKTDNLFGDAIQSAERISLTVKNMGVAMSVSVRNLVSKEIFNKNEKDIVTLSPQDENFLEVLFSGFEAHWQDPDFGIPDFCKSLAMSNSHLYRKTTELLGLSPIALLNEFKLEKARELIKKRRSTISQVTFDAGFASPSYFTKCFKKKYGLLPMTYIDLL
ncbi:MAG: DUF4242 domain-containing protein [Chitinophagaceae bacterium]|nr:DUF4242 domain-containing protein [Chitinophagaceae bacterium]